MLELAGKKIPNTLAEMVDPGRTALLFWDMENAIAPNAFNYKEIVANLKSLKAAARQAGVPVIYSQQVPFDLEREEAGPWVRIRMKRAKATDLAQLLKQKPDPHGKDIVDELRPDPQDVVFQKRRSKSSRTIVIGGVATEGGVEGTARTGRNLGYDIVVLRDCVGSRSRELHELALRLIEGTFFDVATSGEVMEIWRQGK